MYLDMEKYKKDDIKNPEARAYICGIEDSINFLDNAKENYFDEISVESSSHTLLTIHKELINHFVEWARQFLQDERDEQIVAFIDKEATE